MMGVGKSVVGERLARRLEHPYFDVDAWIQDEQRLSIAEIFATRGEAAFRELEVRALPSFLAAPVPCVLAVGGGAVCDRRNRAALDGARVVWLRAGSEVLAERLGSGVGRPLLEGADVAATLTRLGAERDGLYEEVADVVVDVDALTVDEVVERILEEVRG
jgi:shikimate kinase